MRFIWYLKDCKLPQGVIILTAKFSNVGPETWLKVTHFPLLAFSFIAQKPFMIMVSNIEIFCTNDLRGTFQQVYCHKQKNIENKVIQAVIRTKPIFDKIREAFLG